MFAEPSAEGDSKETETVPAFLLTETFRRPFAARMASQSPGGFGSFSHQIDGPSTRLHLPGRGIVLVREDDRPQIVFPENPDGEVVAFEEGFQVFDPGWATDIIPKEASAPRAGFCLLSSSDGVMTAVAW